MSSHKVLVGIFIVVNVILLALALTIGIAAAVGINVPDEYTTIHDAWANAQVAHAPSGPWSFNRTMVAPSSDRWKADFQIHDFMANFQSMRTARKPAMSTAVLQQEQPQALGLSPAVVGSSGDINHVPSVDYPTIQQAIDNATGGETILVEPGRYNETLVINVSHILLKANSTNPADTIVSANGTDDHVITITNQTTNVTIEGFTIQDARGVSQDVAGIFMDNTSECVISNTVIRNISAAGSVDAYGVMMIGTTIKPRFTDTTIRTILGERNSVGIFMENAHNPSFDPTLIENVTAANGTAFGILMAVTDGCFSDTTISDIAGNSSAYGILMIPAINITFDLTVIERVNAPDGEACGIVAEIITGNFTDTTIRDIYPNAVASGIYMSDAENVSFYKTVIERVNSSYLWATGVQWENLINGSFTDTTIRDIYANAEAGGIVMFATENVSFYKTVIERVNSSHAFSAGIYGCLINGSFTNTTIRDIAGNVRACGIEMNATSVTFDPTVIERVTAPDGYTYGILMDPVVDGSFTNTTIRDIAGNEIARGIAMNAINVTFDQTVIERVNGSNDSAYGIDIWSWFFKNGSFVDTTIRDISGYYEACGIYMPDAENVRFNPTVIERVTASAPNGDAYGIYAFKIIDSSFTDTTIRDISGYYGAAGIYMAIAENISFDPTVIERINASSMAVGIYVIYELINGSFTDTTIRDISGYDGAIGIFMIAENVSFDHTVIERVNAPNGAAFSIFAGINNGSFTGTTIRDIVGYDIAAGIYMDAENVSFDHTVIERVNAPNGEAYGTIAAIINGSFTDTTIRDIAGNTSACGIYMYAINVSFLTGELTNCGHGLWLEGGDNNRIEGFIIRDNTLFDTGVHLETDASNTTVCRNCIYNNVLQAWDNGTNNIWIGNYWEPEPGEPTEPYLIPGNAGSKDTAPLTYCPLCAVEVPVTTPTGLIALVGLLSAIAAVTIVRKRR